MAWHIARVIQSSISAWPTQPATNLVRESSLAGTMCKSSCRWIRAVTVARIQAACSIVPSLGLSSRQCSRMNRKLPCISAGSPRSGASMSLFARAARLVLSPRSLSRSCSERFGSARSLSKAHHVGNCFASASKSWEEGGDGCGSEKSSHAIAVARHHDMTTAGAAVLKLRNGTALPPNPFQGPQARASVPLSSPGSE